MLIQERRNIMRITNISRWAKGDKQCTIYGTRETNQVDYTFYVNGWNPLPCKEFKGSYKILANWLIANGWEKIVDTNTYKPDVIIYG
jgi:hypothetical protein